MRNITLFDLISAFGFTLNKMPRKRIHNITRFTVTLDEQINFIMDIFKIKDRASFFELMKNMKEKLRIVVTFLAILELAKNRDLVIAQKNPYADIMIVKISKN